MLKIIENFEDFDSIYDLVDNYLTEKIDLELFYNEIKAYNNLDIIEIINLIGIEYFKHNCETKNNESIKELFTLLINNLINFYDFDENKFKEKLDKELLGIINYIDFSNFENKYNRIITKLYYEQNKYNLFCESNEGYSKIIYQLIQDIQSDEQFKYSVSNILDLIGFFSLDPNKILDLFIELKIYNRNIFYKSDCCNFFKEFKNNNIINLINNKIINFSNNNKLENNYLDNFVILVIDLIEDSIIEIDDLLKLFDLDELNNEYINKINNSYSVILISYLKKTLY